ncbi:23S rRNA (pseudouridine(1915)-N(3))-methyltransferase RlmH [Mycoplasma sp. Mirounga ES2805-ORL]|uniref:23S rRNA (pseudouridine(1915)-N(3))-methyltransferase RlmH n=1 Tax=Mycoplasma sp. Mirounga ES2805-ORL TaxID=754514 RepID=UPI00197B6753|nr:23S rRNA (pseudouridine(1915)-N(3))-methyltransferase RlmH [Mycoplasma sp. Mirounga ES2805-ORL]QSF13454.1 23S rRNA (pseudouridine(1915)-N(3))-methyltransferase RlmH [Mycoplasma sp. Mirounga ES2805-ORL]
MRQIRIIAVGSLTSDFKSIFDDYARKIGYMGSLSVIEIKELSSEKNIEIKKKKETELITKKIDSKSFNVLLSIDGKQQDSLKFSKIFESINNITFIIGGSDGVDENQLNVDMKLSFSKMTFPHQLFRVLLAEQIYRALSILGNQKYHK